MGRSNSLNHSVCISAGDSTTRSRNCDDVVIHCNSSSDNFCQTTYVAYDSTESCNSPSLGKSYTHGIVRYCRNKGGGRNRKIKETIVTRVIQVTIVSLILYYPFKIFSCACWSVFYLLNSTFADKIALIFLKNLAILELFTTVKLVLFIIFSYLLSKSIILFI